MTDTEFLLYFPTIGDYNWVRRDGLRIIPNDDWIDDCPWLGTLDLPDVYFESEYKFQRILS